MIETFYGKSGILYSSHQEAKKENPSSTIVRKTEDPNQSVWSTLFRIEYAGQGMRTPSRDFESVAIAFWGDTLIKYPTYKEARLSNSKGQIRVDMSLGGSINWEDVFSK